MVFFSGKIRFDAASHIVVHRLVFEAILFIYLVTALWMQNLNIYKKNLHLIDYNLLFFIVLLLSRRLMWSTFQELQLRVRFLGWNSRYWFVAASAVALMAWVLQQLLQNTSLFNLLFLFYPILLYISLFGFTLDPRQYRKRFSPPRKFLDHINMSGRIQLNRYNFPGVNQGQPNEMRILLLPATPEEIRTEVGVLISDLIARLKQLLFNSLICAYYVGFIPILFTPTYVYFDKWWSIELTFFIWANSFVILSCLLLPPNYCHILYQCALHLGCWARCSPDIKAPKWSPDVKWMGDSVVEWNTEYFKGEGLQNVAIPCDSTQECFYLLFSSQLHVHTWLLAMQCVVVIFEVVVLTRVIYWYQILTMSSGSKSRVRYSRLTQVSRDKDETEYSDEQFTEAPPKIPLKSIALAIVLFILGSVLLTLAVLIFVGVFGDNPDASATPLIIIGAITFIPGFYHVRLAYYAWKGYHGYSFEDIPSYDD